MASWRAGAAANGDHGEAGLSGGRSQNSEISELPDGPPQPRVAARLLWDVGKR